MIAVECNYKTCRLIVSLHHIILQSKKTFQILLSLIMIRAFFDMLGLMKLKLKIKIFIFSNSL